MLTIAEQFYGDAALWPRIYAANKALIGDDPDALRLGMQLTIPPAG
jgi:nucleoid-associated protein YgaU